MKDDSEKLARLAHKILTKTIWPAKLELEEAMEVVVMLAKSLILSNTDDADPDDRAELIDCVEDHFLTAMNEINPKAEPSEHVHDPAHAWLVSPQGLITEPVGFLWSGCSDDGVEVLIGEKLTELRSELADAPEDAAVVVIDGVEGIAMTDPTWDGESMIPCANPQCGNVHDVHLMVAEHLFQEAKQRQFLAATSN